MSDFNKTNWANGEFSRGYRENADVFIIERRRMLAILQSFYAHFVRNGAQRTILDLGCGDGIVTSAIAGIDDRISATLVDGSRDMLEKARVRLNGLKRTRYIHASFQEMLLQDRIQGPFDFVASSLAIHHLTFDEKLGLFEKI